MALFPIHDFFIFNGDLKPVSGFIPSENNGGIYEVLRVVDGVPLFLEDHIFRLYKSAKIAGKTVVFSELQIREYLKSLIWKNNIDNGNLLISCKTNLKIFFISHNYPSVEMFTKGVECGILQAERENPNAKIFQTSVRKKANEMISKYDFYEVVLIDKSNRISEGSRSNLFFVKGDQIITTPGSGVLLGITRQKIIQIAKAQGLDFIEKEVQLNDLTTFDAVFITGTSSKILPVRQIGETSFNPQNIILQALMEGYNKLITEYIIPNGY